MPAGADRQCSQAWRSPLRHLGADRANFWGLAAFAFAYGIFYGGFVAILPALAMDHFGGRNVSGIIGVLYTSVALGTLIGPSAAGFAFDFSHRYMLLPILAKRRRQCRRNHQSWRSFRKRRAPKAWREPYSAL